MSGGINFEKPCAFSPKHRCGNGGVAVSEQYHDAVILPRKRALDVSGCSRSVEVGRKVRLGPMLEHSADMPRHHPWQR